MEKRKSMYTRDYKKLGFIVSTVSPASSPLRSSPADLSHSERVVLLCCTEQFPHFQMFRWFK